MGTPLFVVTNGLLLFVARDILARYGLYGWDSYNGKTSYKIISVAYSMNFYQKLPQKTTWENTMAKHVRPSYFPIWYIGGTISQNTIYIIITDLLMESNPHLMAPVLMAPLDGLENKASCC